MNRQQLENSFPAPKLNGYRAWHRNTWLLIAERRLSSQAVLLYQYLIDQADFDPNHKTYGMVEISLSQIGEVFDRKSQNTIRGWLRELASIGFIVNLDRKNWYRLTRFVRYMSPGKWGGKAAEFSRIETGKSTEEIVQLIATEIQLVEEKAQSIEEMYTILTQEGGSIAIGSSKVNSRVNKGISVEDAEWINKHVKE